MDYQDRGLAADLHRVTRHACLAIRGDCDPVAPIYLKFSRSDQLRNSRYSSAVRQCFNRSLSSSVLSPLAHLLAHSIRTGNS